MTNDVQAKADLAAVRIDTAQTLLLLAAEKLEDARWTAEAFPADEAWAAEQAEREALRVACCGSGLSPLARAQWLISLALADLGAADTPGFIKWVGNAEPAVAAAGSGTETN